MSGTVVVVVIVLVIILIPWGKEMAKHSTPEKRNYTYHAMKAAQRGEAAARKARAHRERLDGVRQVWQPRIERAGRKAAGAASRGKMKKATQHGIRESELIKLRNREVSLMNRLHNSAAGGNKKAQRLTGKIHPKTGEVTGGIGRHGFRHSDHGTPVRQPKKPAWRQWVEGKRKKP